MTSGAKFLANSHPGSILAHANGCNGCGVLGEQRLPGANNALLYTLMDTTAYDPTCGSASLLLKLASLALHSKGVKITLYGQEKDSSTAGLARMNMILHDCPTAEIKQGNTLANPLFLDGDSLKTFDFAAANPPFSDKRRSTGLDPEHDPFQRFEGFGVPPDKPGDYAYWEVIPGVRAALFKKTAHRGYKHLKRMGCQS